MRPVRPVAAFLVAVALAGCATAPLAPAPTTRTASVANGFAFDVPAPLDVRAWSPDFVSIGRPDGEGFASQADLRLVTARRGESTQGFESFAAATLRELCASGGQGGDVTCGQPRMLQPVTSSSMLQGAVVSVERAWTDPTTGAAATDAFGPVYVFDVSDRVPGAGPAALILSPPPALRPPESGDDLLRRLARSLAFEDQAR